MKRYLPGLIGGFVVFIAILIFSNATFITIDAGEAGVKFKKFGGGLEKDAVYKQGFKVVAPWDRMIIYDTRINEIFEKMDVLSANGLEIHIEVTVRYSLVPEKIGYLHEEVGSRFRQTIIIPEIRSAVREVVGKYTPEELYSSRREGIQTEIQDKIESELKKKYIITDALLIRSINLPDRIKQAIELKLDQEQQAQAYEFRLKKEQKEAERKRIEAQGIQDYQRIVNDGLTNQLLRWKGIEATEKLAGSQNAKIVVIGSGKDGLPLILNTDK